MQPGSADVSREPVGVLHAHLAGPDPRRGSRGDAFNPRSREDQLDGVQGVVPAKVDTVLLPHDSSGVFGLLPYGILSNLKFHPLFLQMYSYI